MVRESYQKEHVHNGQGFQDNVIVKDSSTNRYTCNNNK